ncbi:formin-binding protein 1 [Mytilus galloprovincialis]|uniref:Formin-binding protein 1 n=1 Tax=Mytilus galloprovincialis TaxID=29158 RepID=A0A8B6GB63_MYTGA|nr:formin-binding protein 1 [Mytilus galloprovincialis]
MKHENLIKRLFLHIQYVFSGVDQYDTVAVHTQKGVDFCERFTNFLKERSHIEFEYAKNLKRLVKNYQPKKKDEEEYGQFSWARAFWDLLKELHDLAGQHEVIAENTQGNVMKDLSNLIQDYKQDRKKELQEGAKIQEQLKASLAQLEKREKQYEKAFREAEKATDAYRRADADINLSRAEVEKHRNNMMLKSQQSDDCKNEYASQLQQTNQHQHEHYHTHMPQVFQRLQNIDENRIDKMKSYIKQSADIERNIIPIINTCIDGMVKASDSINAVEDSRSVVNKYKSGYPIPSDIAFDDLSNSQVPDGRNGNTLTTTPKNLNLEKGSVRQTVSGGKSKKRTGILGLFSSSKTNVTRSDDPKEDFSDLPPSQRKKQLLKKIDSIKKEITRETAEREGMLKMKDVYVQNPALGDPNSLDKKIEENGEKLDSCRKELSKFVSYLDDAEGKKSTTSLAVSDDSLSRSTSDGSVNRDPNIIPPPPSIQQPNNDVYTPDIPHSPKKKSSIPDDDELHSPDEFEDPEILEQYPVIGTCRALYSFTAENEGSVTMEENEEMSVLEQDQGDGWTRVRKKDEGEGFVPTSYIQIHFFDQDEV